MHITDSKKKKKQNYYIKYTAQRVLGMSIFCFFTVNCKGFFFLNLAVFYRKIIYEGVLNHIVFTVHQVTVNHLTVYFLQCFL